MIYIANAAGMRALLVANWSVLATSASARITIGSGGRTRTPVSSAGRTLQGSHQ